MAIRAITFDFWRTLFRHTHSDVRRQGRIEDFCRETGADPAAADRAMAFAEAEFTRIHLGDHRTLGPDDAVRIMAGRLGIVMAADSEKRLAHDFARGILDPPPPIIDGAAEAVRAAARRHPVGIISDTGFSPGHYLREILAANDLLDVFEVLVFSDEVGVSKPMPAMYERAAEGLGVRPDELFHLGDLEMTDIVGAHGVGAKAGLFAGDNERFVNETSADYVFRSWREFIEWLPEIGADRWGMSE